MLTTKDIQKLKEVFYSKEELDERLNKTFYSKEDLDMKFYSKDELDEKLDKKLIGQTKSLIKSFTKLQMDFWDQILEPPVNNILLNFDRLPTKEYIDDKFSNFKVDMGKEFIKQPRPIRPK